jgi:hypothetical protein
LLGGLKFKADIADINRDGYGRSIEDEEDVWIHSPYRTGSIQWRPPNPQGARDSPLTNAAVESKTQLPLRPKKMTRTLPMTMRICTTLMS